MAPRRSLDIRAQGSSAAIKHNTITKVVSGAVAIMVNHQGDNNSRCTRHYLGNRIMFDSCTATLCSNV